MASSLRGFSGFSGLIRYQRLGFWAASALLENVLLTIFTYTFVQLMVDSMDSGIFRLKDISVANTLQISGTLQVIPETILYVDQIEFSAISGTSVSLFYQCMTALQVNKSDP